MRLTAHLAIALLQMSMAAGFHPASGGTPAQAVPSAPIFVFETNEFWLNLHHFLYVLGRARSKTQDASRTAVAGAPAEAERALNGLPPAEQELWADAVSRYSSGLSQLDAVRGTPMPEITLALADADDAATLAGVSIDSAVRDTLERAAPVLSREPH